MFLFDGDSGAGGKEGEQNKDGEGKNAASGEQGGTSSEKKTFTQEELGKIIADERRAERAKAKADFEAEQKKLADDAEEKRKREEAAARGEFDTVKAKLEADLDTVKREKESLEARVTSLTEAIQKVLADDWDKLPDEIREAYEAAGGDKDDVLAKINYLPQGKKLAEKMGERKERREGNSQNPPPKRDGQNGDVESERRALRATGNYRM